MSQDVILGQWNLENFQAERRQLLGTWETGSQVDLEEAAAWHASLPPAKNMVQALRAARAEGRVLVQPRAGIAPLSKHLELMRMLQDEGGADILPATTDSLTRHRKYEMVAKAIRDSEKKGVSTLNGFPIVNCGVTGCRTLSRELKLPLEVRSASDDMRLPTEIGLAGGMSAGLGGPIVHCLQHCRNTPPEKVVRDHQYVHRLVAEYQRRGVDVLMETAGYMSAHMVPPSMAVAIVCLEGLVMAEQGVKHIMLGYEQSGHLLQDLAAVRALRNLGTRLMSEHPDVTLWFDFHMWAGRFPEDQSRAYGVIIQGAIVAAMAGVDMVMSKSIDQGKYLPQGPANAAAIRATQQVLGMMQHQRLEELPAAWAEETAEIEAESTAVVDRTLELGDGSVGVGTARAIRAGVVDLPFGTSMFAANRLLPVRNGTGAIYYLDPGSAPFTEAMKRYHRAKLQKRAAEGKGLDYMNTVADAIAIAEGVLVGNKDRLVGAAR